MRPIRLGVLSATILAVSACAGASTATTAPVATPPAVTPPSASQEAVPTAAATAASPGEAVELTAGTDTDAQLKFDPADLTVKAGADVRVTFENRATVPHNLTFEAPINVATASVVAPGTSEAVEFVAPAAGEYTFVCTLHPGMEGKLIVEAG
jgi:plastocyanin